MKIQNPNRKLTVTLIVVSLLQMGMVAMSPIMSSVKAAFPGASELAVQMAATFMNLIMMIVSALDGYIDKVLGRRRMVILGMALCVAVAVLGRCCSVGLWTVYIWSGMLGVGTGLFVPAMSSMMLTYYDGDDRRKITGLQSVFSNAGGVALSLLSGFLAATLWKNAYLVFSFAILPLILSICFIPRDEHRQPDDGREAEKNGRPAGWKLPARVWSAAIGTCGFAVCYFVFTTNISYLLGEKGLDPTSAAGVVMACFMLGGALGGALLPKAMKIFTDFMPAIAFTLVAASYIVLVAAGGIVPVCIASIIGGASISFFFPYLMLLVGGSVDPSISVISTSLIISVGPNLGSFASPLIVTNLTKLLLDESASGRFLLTAIAAAVIAGNIAVSVLFKRRKKA